MLGAGIPPYIAAMVADPPLVATIPIVAVALPQAIANVGALAEGAGTAVTAACYNQFDRALALSKGGIQ